MIRIWFSQCHCHPIISCFIKIQTGLTFLVAAYQVVLEKNAIKRAPKFQFLGNWLFLFPLLSAFSFLELLPKREPTGAAFYIDDALPVIQPMVSKL